MQFSLIRRDFARRLFIEIKTRFVKHPSSESKLKASPEANQNRIRHDISVVRRGRGLFSGVVSGCFWIGELIVGDS